MGEVGREANTILKDCEGPRSMKPRGRGVAHPGMIRPTDARRGGFSSFRRWTDRVCRRQQGARICKRWHLGGPLPAACASCAPRKSCGRSCTPCLVSSPPSSQPTDFDLLSRQYPSPRTMTNLRFALTRCVASPPDTQRCTGSPMRCGRPCIPSPLSTPSKPSRFMTPPSPPSSQCFHMLFAHRAAAGGFQTGRRMEAVLPPGRDHARPPPPHRALPWPKRRSRPA